MVLEAWQRTVLEDKVYVVNKERTHKKRAPEIVQHILHVQVGERVCVYQTWVRAGEAPEKNPGGMTMCGNWLFSDEATIVDALVTCLACLAESAPKDP
jgi:hypothetical protein